MSATSAPATSLKTLSLQEQLSIARKGVAAAIQFKESAVTNNENIARENLVNNGINQNGLENRNKNEINRAHNHHHGTEILETKGDVLCLRQQRRDK